MLTREEHAQRLAKILESKEDPALASDILAELSENYAAVLAEHKLAADHENTLKKQNDELVKQNMNLFLKIGTAEPKENRVEVPDERKPIRYEDLIKENGHIL